MYLAFQKYTNKNMEIQLLFIEATNYLFLISKTP